MEILKQKNHYLEVKYDEKNKEINIVGNKEGLEYLGKVCLHLSEKKDPEHWHLSFPFYTLTEDSLDLVISNGKSGGLS